MSIEKSSMSLIDFLKTNGFIILQKSGNVNWERLAKIVDESPHERIRDLSPDFYFIFNDELKTLLTNLFKEYHLTTFSSNKLLKGVDKRTWHTDYPDVNHPCVNKNLFTHGIVSVQVIYPLCDFSHENGATMYVPNSHTLADRPTDEMFNNAKTFTLKANEYLVYVGNLWHSQGINLTEKPRSALLANFTHISVPTKDSTFLN